MCCQKPLPVNDGKRFVYLENLLEAMLPGGSQHLLNAGGEGFRMLRADGAEVVPEGCFRPLVYRFCIRVFLPI